MARPLRLDHAGAVWHVTSRGNERQSIFLAEEDREAFLRTLAETVARFRWNLHAFVLMGNHYHLLLDTPGPTLSQGMHYLNGLYSQRFNRRQGRVGHLMQGRFTGILVQKEAHLLELTRYVVLNPVRAGLVGGPEDWTWSNYRSTAGLCEPPDWLEIDWTLKQFSPHRSVGRSLYCRFVADAGAGGYRPWDRLAGQIYLGDENFQRCAGAEIEDHGPVQGVPLSQTRIGRPTLAWILETASELFGCKLEKPRDRNARCARAIAAYVARQEVGCRLSEIACALRVSASMASRLAARGEQLVAERSELRRSADEILERWWGKEGAFRFKP